MPFYRNSYPVLRTGWFFKIWPFFTARKLTVPFRCEFPSAGRAGLMPSFLNQFGATCELPCADWESVEKQCLPGSPLLMPCVLGSKPALSCPGLSVRIETSKKSRIRYLQLALLTTLFPSSLHPKYEPCSLFTIYSQACIDFHRHSLPKCLLH